MSGTAVATWKASKHSGRTIANASAWIYEHQECKLTSNDLADLASLTVPSVGERADRILVALAKRFPAVGEKVKFAWRDAASWPIGWSETADEMRYLLDQYLIKERKFLTPGEFDLLFPYDGQITPAGHAYLESLRNTGTTSSIGFCAMWFDDSVKNVWSQAIEPAIRDAGYEAVRIDGHQHNNRIDDEILAMIRRSKFVVADFAGQRGGVYFEAGFALGLGRQVIWTCPKEHLKDVHFDNRQYSFVLWEHDKLDEFRKALQYRIEATIGAGLRT